MREKAMKRIHVVGARRSGTTLVAELVGNCFDIDGRIDHEQSLWVPMPEQWRVLLTKKPPDTMHMKRAFLADENLYAIAVVRDPRAVITSRHYGRPNEYFCSFWRWEQYVQMIMSMQDHPRYLVLRYEDLVAQPDEEQRRIAERFDFLTQTCAFSRFPEGAEVHEHAQGSLNGLRSVDQASLTKWREHLPRIKGELLKHPNLSDWLIRMGYEADASWEAELAEVEPWFGDYKNEKPHLGRRIETYLRYSWQTRAYLKRRAVS